MTFKTLTTTLLLSTSFLLFTACNSKTTQEEANATTVQNPTTTETTVDTSVDTDTSTDDDTVTGTETTGGGDGTDTTPQTDSTPPNITLNGEANIALTKDDVYEELGATATDAVDGTVSVSIGGSVDTSTVGTYTMVYSAADKAGNEASVSRIVNVEEKINKIKTLTLITSKTRFIKEKETYAEKQHKLIRIPIKVIATYEDGQSEEITDMVTWNANKEKVKYRNDKLAVKMGSYTVSTSFNGVTSRLGVR